MQGNAQMSVVALSRKYMMEAHLAGRSCREMAAWPRRTVSWWIIIYIPMYYPSHLMYRTLLICRRPWMAFLCLSILGWLMWRPTTTPSPMSGGGAGLWRGSSPKGTHRKSHIIGLSLICLIFSWPIICLCSTTSRYKGSLWGLNLPPPYASLYLGEWEQSIFFDE